MFINIQGVVGQVLPVVPRPLQGVGCLREEAGLLALQAVDEGHRIALPPKPSLLLAIPSEDVNRFAVFGLPSRPAVACPANDEGSCGRRRIELDVVKHNTVLVGTGLTRFTDGRGKTTAFH